MAARKALSRVSLCTLEEVVTTEMHVRLHPHIASDPYGLRLRCCLIWTIDYMDHTTLLGSRTSCPYQVQLALLEAIRQIRSRPHAFANPFLLLLPLNTTY